MRVNAFPTPISRFLEMTSGVPGPRRVSLPEVVTPFLFERAMGIANGGRNRVHSLEVKINSLSPTLSQAV